MWREKIQNLWKLARVNTVLSFDIFWPVECYYYLEKGWCMQSQVLSYKMSRSLSWTWFPWNSVPPRRFVEEFNWDIAKYPYRQALPELVQSILMVISRANVPHFPEKWLLLNERYMCGCRALGVSRMSSSLWQSSVRKLLNSLQP